MVAAAFGAGMVGGVLFSWVVSGLLRAGKGSADGVAAPAWVLQCGVFDGLAHHADGGAAISMR